MFEGKINAAIKLLSNEGMGGFLHVDDMIQLGNSEPKSVYNILVSKHPPSQPVLPAAVFNNGRGGSTGGGGQGGQLPPLSF